MTPRQLAELRGYVSLWIVLGRAVLLAIAGVVAGALFRGLARSIAPQAHPGWWIAPAVAVTAILFVLAKRGTGGPELRARIRADLAGGVLRVDRIEVIEAIEVEEQEDEGPAYFIKTANPHVLVFSGQYLANLKRRGFPWRVFELEESPASKLIFHLTRIEAPIRPSFVREPFTFAEFKTYGGTKYRNLDVEFDTLKIKPSSRA